MRKLGSLALDLTLKAVKSGISMTRFDGFNSRTFNTNPIMGPASELQAPSVGPSSQGKKISAEVSP